MSGSDDRRSSAGGWAPPSVPEHDAAAGDGSESPPSPGPANRRRTYLVVASLAVIVAGSAALLATRGDGGTATIAIEEGEIGDADEVLSDATEEFLAGVEAAGAVAADGAGCFWMLAPDGPEGGERYAQSVVCGPARFVAGGDWVEAPIDTTASTEDGASVMIPFERAEFRDADDLGIGTDSDAVEFVGVDGAQPASSEAELAEPDRAGRAFTADGRVLEAPEELIDAGLDLVSSPSGNAPLNVHPDASCWIPDDAVGETGDAGSAQSAMGQLLCGPILGLDDNPDQPWKIVEYELAAGDGPWAAAGDPDTVNITDSTVLPTGVGLFHPDGSEPPSTDDFGLPDPLPVDDQYIGIARAASTAGLTFDDQAASTIRTPDFVVTIGGHATVGRIGEGASALIAPDGHQLVAFKYAANEVNQDGSTGQVDESSTAAVLAVGDHERTLELSELESFDGDFDPAYETGGIYDTSDETYVIVAAVPENVTDVGLEIQNRGVAQRVSVQTGEATGLAPGSRRHGREVQLAKRFDIALTAPGASGVENPPDRAGHFRGVVNRATLSMWDGERRWAPDGTIFLTVDVSDIAIGSGGTAWGVDLNWASTIDVVLPNGKVVQPVGVSSDLGAYQPEVLRYAVPLDAKRATVRVAPKGQMDSAVDGSAYRLSIDRAVEAPVTLR